MGDTEQLYIAQALAEYCVTQVILGILLYVLLYYVNHVSVFGLTFGLGVYPGHEIGLFLTLASNHVKVFKALLHALPFLPAVGR